MEDDGEGFEGEVDDAVDEGGVEGDECEYGLGEEHSFFFVVFALAIYIQEFDWFRARRTG